MEIDISKQEAWKILDALVAYKKDILWPGLLVKFLTMLQKNSKKLSKETEYEKVRCVCAG
jgi:hypothetical protein